jgi:precorrin-6B methylase 2
MDFITIALSVALVVILVLNVIGVWWVIHLLTPLVHYGGPYVPTRPEDVEEMIRSAQIVNTDKIADLGSGDGRIVIAAAKAGAADALGIEIHPGLVKKSQWAAKRAGLTNARFVKGSFWKTDLSDRTVVFLYQVPYTMKRLEGKLQAELPPGARVVTNGFVFEHWKPSEEHGHIRVYRKVEG